MRTQEASGSGTTQRLGQVIGHLVVYEPLREAVPVVSNAPRQEELRINEVSVLATELDRVFAMRPGHVIHDFVGILLLVLVVAWADRIAAQVLSDRHVVHTHRARVRERQRVVRILQAQVIHPMTADGPRIGERDLAVTNRLGLIEHGLGRIYRVDELLLVEQEPRTELMLSPSVVRIELYVVLSLKDRTDYREVASRNVGRPRGGVPRGFTWAVHTDSFRGIRRRSYREIGQDIRYR